MRSERDSAEASTTEESLNTKREKRTPTTNGTNLDVARRKGTPAAQVKRRGPTPVMKRSQAIRRKGETAAALLLRAKLIAKNQGEKKTRKRRRKKIVMMEIFPSMTSVDGAMRKKKRSSCKPFTLSPKWIKCI